MTQAIQLSTDSLLTQEPSSASPPTPEPPSSSPLLNQSSDHVHIPHQGASSDQRLSTAVPTELLQLATECSYRRWKVNIIDSDGTITETTFAAKDAWSLPSGKRIIVEFNRLGQPIGNSGGLLSQWLGQLVCDTNLLPVNYTDWRKVSHQKKETAWRLIKLKFHFDYESKKKYIMQSLGIRCKDFKSRLWEKYKKGTREETYENCPKTILKKEWKEFVNLQFSDRQKEIRERNVINRSHMKVFHSLGKKSLARKAHEMELETGKHPDRAELFVASRKRKDGTFVCEEAKTIAKKLTQHVTLNAKNVSATNIMASVNDKFAEVCGKEHPGRVRCLGFGATPTLVLNHSGGTSTGEGDEIKALKMKLQKMEQIVLNLQQEMNFLRQEKSRMPPRVNENFQPSVNNQKDEASNDHNQDNDDMNDGDTSVSSNAPYHRHLPNSKMNV